MAEWKIKIAKNSKNPTCLAVSIYSYPDYWDAFQFVTKKFYIDKSLKVGTKDTGFTLRKGYPLVVPLSIMANDVKAKAARVDILRLANEAQINIKEANITIVDSIF